jgi:hypothetical protein
MANISISNSANFFSLSLICALTFSCAACSSRGMTLVKGTSPPTFRLSGNYAARHFQVTTQQGERVWLIYVRENDTTLSDIATIQYGFVPSCCYQDFPSGPPPPLKEGVPYVASADIYDGAAVSVDFTIINGKAVGSRAGP